MPLLFFLRYTSAMKTIRPLFLAFLFVSSAFLTSPKSKPSQTSSHPDLALVGTYTAKTQSKGIYILQFDERTGEFRVAGVAAETPNPSWVLVHPNGKFVYAANESGKNSTVSAFALDPQTGKLTLLNQLPALGEDPCHLAFDTTGKFLFVANYTSGTVAVFPILPDGKLGEHTAAVKDEGKLGPNAKRQEGPHAHWVQVSPDDHSLFVSDLGLDAVQKLGFDPSKGSLSPDPAAGTHVAPGSGPRHVAFSADGKYMYVLSELQNTVSVFAKDAHGNYQPGQIISALPSGFQGKSDAAEIVLHPSGKWLYTSNRGSDTIAVFAVDPAHGTLRLLADVPSGGKEPRHFIIDPSGQFLLAENQHSDSIVEFRIDSNTGALTPTGRVVHVPSPVCLTFLAGH